MTNRIKAVIWDMGGVFLRSMDSSPREELADQYGLSLDEINKLVFNSESAYIATVGKIDVETHWMQTGSKLGITGKELDRFREKFFEGDRIDYDLINFIRQLKPSSTTGLLSNAWSDMRWILTKSKPCIDAFHISVFSYEVGLAKPDPEIYTYILRLCGMEPEEAIFIDDVQGNIDAANDLGIHGIHFTDPRQAMRDVSILLGDMKKGK